MSWAKILSGIKSVLVHDCGQVDYTDLSSQVKKVKLTYFIEVIYF
jgi:hypothetical protein